MYEDQHSPTTRRINRGGGTTTTMSPIAISSPPVTLQAVQEQQRVTRGYQNANNLSRSIDNGKGKKREREEEEDLPKPSSSRLLTSRRNASTTNGEGSGTGTGMAVGSPRSSLRGVDPPPKRLRSNPTLNPDLHPNSISASAITTTTSSRISTRSSQPNLNPSQPQPPHPNPASYSQQERSLPITRQSSSREEDFDMISPAKPKPPKSNLRSSTTTSTAINEASTTTISTRSSRQSTDNNASANSSGDQSIVMPKRERATRTRDIFDPTPIDSSNQGRITRASASSTTNGNNGARSFGIPPLLTRSSRRSAGSGGRKSITRTEVEGEEDDELLLKQNSTPPGSETLVQQSQSQSRSQSQQSQSQAQTLVQSQSQPQVKAPVEKVVEAVAVEELDGGVEELIEDIDGDELVDQKIGIVAAGEMEMKMEVDATPQAESKAEPVQELEQEQEEEYKPVPPVFAEQPAEEIVFPEEVEDEDVGAVVEEDDDGDDQMDVDPRLEVEGGQQLQQEIGEYPQQTLDPASSNQGEDEEYQHEFAEGEGDYSEDEDAYSSDFTGSEPPNSQRSIIENLIFEDKLASPSLAHLQNLSPEALRNALSNIRVMKAMREGPAGGMTTSEREMILAESEQLYEKFMGDGGGGQLGDGEVDFRDSRFWAERLEIMSDLKDVRRGNPGLGPMGSYRIVDRLGEGTFSSVYKAVDLFHNHHDNAPWGTSSSTQDPTTQPDSSSPNSASSTSAQLQTSNSNPNQHPSQRNSSSASWLAKSTKPNGPVYVALKRIYVTSSPDRISNELALMIAARGARNTAYLISAFRSGDQVIAVMPYHRNDDFRLFYRLIDPPHMRIYFRCLFRALKDIHRQDIIHRDVKPANFLFDYKGKTGVLCDFGLAELYEPPTKQACQHGPGTAKNRHGIMGFTPMTQWVERAVEDARVKSRMGEGKVGFLKHDIRPPIKANRAGTRGFRAPEVLLKCPDQTTAIDIWAAGVMLLSMLCHKFPVFNSNDDVEALMEIGAVFGQVSMEKCAMLHNRTITSNVPYLKPESTAKGKNPVRNPLTKMVLKLNPRIYEPPTRDATPEEAKSHIEAIDSALDLLEQLMRVNSCSRYTAHQALKHPFLREGVTDEEWEIERALERDAWKKDDLKQ